MPSVGVAVAWTETSGVGVAVAGADVLVAGTLVLVDATVVAVSGGGVAVPAEGVDVAGTAVAVSPTGTAVTVAAGVSVETSVAVDVAAAPVLGEDVAVADGLSGRPVTVDAALTAEAPGVGEARRVRFGRRRTVDTPSVSPLECSWGDTSIATDPSEDGASACGAAMTRPSSPGSSASAPDASAIDATAPSSCRG
jgi:hypothetical protein